MTTAYDEARKQVEALVLGALADNSLESEAAGILRIEPSKTPEYDLACSIAFSLSKKAGKPPAELANQLFQSMKSELKEDGKGYVESAAAVNGYLNFVLSSKYYIDSFAAAAKAGQTFGNSDANSGKLAIVEYSSPNVGKPMHIGHIRSTILGDAVANLHVATGYKVVRMNYLCEAGAQVGSLLLALQKWGMEKLNNEKDLLKYYVDITKKIEEDPTLKTQEQEMVLQMENYDPEIMPLLYKVRELTLTPFDANYKRLGISFDEPVFDSDYVAASKKLVEECLEKGIATKDKTGETVGLLEGKSKLSNLIILRSNGTTLYSTRDMGFAQWRWEKYHFDKSVIVTASEQNTHFKQVFKLLELMGREYTDRLFHIGFGLVFLEGGVKLSSRKGNVLLLVDVLDDAVDLAKAQIKTDQGYSDDDLSKIAEAVGVGAVKFAILRVSAEKNIQFTTQKAVSFEGDTGAYLQYTVVRGKNILKKSGLDVSNLTASLPENYEFSDPERVLASMIANYPQVVSSAAASMAPHQICDYCLKMAASFSSFYTQCSVLEADTPEKKTVRLALVAATVGALEHGLGLLGIVVPEKM